MESSTRRHSTSWAKVNAPVDERIVPLIEALSCFNRLQTFESCQGYGEEPASVDFMYGNIDEKPWEDMVEFIFEFLAPRLDVHVGDGVYISIRRHMTGVAVANLCVNQEALNKTVRAIRRLAREFSTSHQPHS